MPDTTRRVAMSLLALGVGLSAAMAGAWAADAMTPEQRIARARGILWSLPESDRAAIEAQADKSSSSPEEVIVGIQDARRNAPRSRGVGGGSGNWPNIPDE